MAISYGTASTGGGAQNFRVGYEFLGWSAVDSSSATVTGTIRFYVRNAAAVTSDLQTFNHVYTNVSTAAPAQVQITNTQTVATDRTIGPERTVTYTYSTWGSSPGNFTGSITGLGSASGTDGFYTGGPAYHDWTIAIPARPGGVPSEPTSVSSTPGNGSVSISFGAPSTNDPATSLYQQSQDNVNWDAISTNPFTVSGTNGTALTVYVRAYNAAGFGPSASATSTPRTVPSAPQSFAGSNTTFGQLSLSWAAPSSNGGNAVSSYVLRTGSTVLQNTSATSYVHTGLSPYTDYSYTVTAANAAGESTTASLTVKTMGGVAKVWNGTAWVTILPKVWNGTAWVEAQARMWNGTSWVHGI